MDKYAIIDVETTGGSPATSKITEIAVFIHDGEKVVDEFVSLLNPECEIPRFVVNLTGITQEMVEAAPLFKQIASRILEMTSDCVFVAHNVGFDYGMIRKEFRELGIDYRLPHLCTVQTSRRILPGYESYSLGKLTQHLGINIDGRHRAGGDALATVKLFELLITKDDQQFKKMIANELKLKELNPKLDVDSIDNLPLKAGIFEFYNETNQLIFIGSNANIKKSVYAYLKGSSSKKRAQLRQEITRVEFELTGSELIANLLVSRKLEKRPTQFNVKQKKEAFPYGLFQLQETTENQHLVIEKITQRQEIPLCGFSSVIEGNRFLKTAFSKYEITILKQTVDNDFEVVNNTTFSDFITALSLDRKNFFIVDKGRETKEKSIVLIENGSFVGFGYLHFSEMKKSIQHWKNAIQRYSEHKDDYVMIQHFLNKTEKPALRSFV